MAQLLIFLLALYQLQTPVYSEVLDSPKFSSTTDNEDDINDLIPPSDIQDLFSTEQHDNDIDEETFGPSLTDNITNEDVALVKGSHDQAEMIFRHPIASVNIDYARNMILLRFRKERLKQHMKINAEEEQRRRQLENNFMRFGRTPGSQDFMRFGRSPNSQDFMRFGRSPTSQDFMRFGRSSNSQDFMRFGRSPNSQDFMRFGRSPTSQDFMRFGRSPNSQDFMRFGRSPTSQDFMRFGRSPTSQDFMRFGRSPTSQDFMRFGKRQLEELPSVNSIEEDFFYKDPNGRYERSSEVMRDSRGDNFMRFGRSSQDFMRFGRNPSDFMRLGRSPDDFMRLGRSPSDFMRLGRSADDFMRLGRSQADFMRFGRTPEDFMRFGRSAADGSKQFGNGGESSDFMRFGRSPGDFMRFGRDSNSNPELDRNFMRFGRSDNFMRFGRSPTEPKDNSSNFMRFGKSGKNSTEVQEQKNKVKQMMLADHEKDSGESNPMDKAIKVLYNNKQKESSELEGKNHEAESADADYVLNMLDK